MSDIPKSERSESSLETQHLVYALRRKITTELLTSFGYSEKKLEEHVKRVTAYIKDKEERKARQEMLLVLMQDFSMWLIEDERDDIADLCREISRHLRQANTIWPNYYAEYIERRLELDRARECCNALQDELQYIAEQLPADKNRYMGIVLDFEEIYNKIGALRQSDNRFLDSLPDVPDEVRQRREKEQAKSARRRKRTRKR